MTKNNKILVDALDRLAAEDFVTGQAWSALHDLCQAHEGEADFDRAHALCHRIEGDEGNAAYWYRRAGQPRPSASVAEECADLKRVLED
nr:hypothetical protein [Hoeflea marina]